MSLVNQILGGGDNGTVTVDQSEGGKTLTVVLGVVAVVVLILIFRNR